MVYSSKSLEIAYVPIRDRLYQIQYIPETQLSIAIKKKVNLYMLILKEISIYGDLHNLHIC